MTAGRELVIVVTPDEMVIVGPVIVTMLGDRVMVYVCVE